jgi:hypothetical protein
MQITLSLEKYNFFYYSRNHILPHVLCSSVIAGKWKFNRLVFKQGL